MSFQKYKKYKILIDPKSKKTQGLRLGDIVRRQYFDNPNLIYTLMAVIETGIDVIAGEDSPYFIGALLEGDEPKTGELLDFVRVTSLTDSDRSGALYLTASDSDAPFMDVIDGLAIEKSIVHPIALGMDTDVPAKDFYTCMGTTHLLTSYSESDNEGCRILRMENQTGFQSDLLGIKQTLSKVPEHPARLLLSFKIRSSRDGYNNEVRFAFTDDSQNEGSEFINIDTQWQYHFFIINIEYPAHYSRSLSIILNNTLKQAGDWCEISDFNIVELSSVSNFSDGTKSRIGKIKGIVDPVFGALDGYGAYFQHIYATRNVNIAGTLTAGDENGFSSTFYVGKIHKNVIENSIDCDTKGNVVPIDSGSPVGIGNILVIKDEGSLVVQSESWTNGHDNKQYCFSFWAKSEKVISVQLNQNETFIRQVEINSNDWKRYHVAFFIAGGKKAKLSLDFILPNEEMTLSAPQLEAGNKPSQYQPTDGTLSYVEDYGAWFSKGGIGGTIQNPLLKLNEDGSISSRDNSFVINPDGTGYFASGRFTWSKDTITLKDVTIKWEDFDEEAKDNLTAKSVKLSGVNTFHYQDDNKNCEPGEITVIATENNFISSESRWQYLSADNIWKDLPQRNINILQINPDSHYWEDQTLLTLKYISVYSGKEFSDTFTITKMYDGADSYTIFIDSSNGCMFKNGVISTTLKAIVYKAGTDISHLIPDNSFTWKRVSKNVTEDGIWNSMEHKGRLLEITGDDVTGKAIFDCEVIIL